MYAIDLFQYGVDLINCSSGGVVENQSIPSGDPYFQHDYSKKVKETGVNYLINCRL